MRSEQSGIENYGYQLPKQLSNPHWKKCLDYVNGNKDQIYQGIINIRQYLSQDINVDILIVNILESQIHKPLIRFAKAILNSINKNQATQIEVNCLYELIWIFTNLCSGSKQNTSKLIEIGVVNFCKECFCLQNYGHIISIIFELLGNLAGQLNLQIKLGFLSDPNFYNFMNTKYKNYLHINNFHQNASWAFHNLFRDFNICPQKDSFIYADTLISPYLPIIKELLEIQKQEAISNLLHIFFYLSKDQEFFMNEVLQILQKFLYCNNQTILHLTIQIIGNYIANCDEAVDYALNHPHFLNIVFNLLKKQNKIKYRKQSAWIISNIFGGNFAQVQKFVTIPTLFNQLHNALINEAQQSVLKQLVWCLANCYSTCSEKAFETIYQSSIIEPLSIKIRECTDQTIFSVYSEGMVHYLKKFQSNPNLDFNIFLRNIKEIENSFVYIEEMQYNSVKIMMLIEKCRERISFLVYRGPITQEEMVKNHLENIKF